MTIETACFMHGEVTPELIRFRDDLFAILASDDERVIPRTPESDRIYLEYCAIRGKEGLVEDVRTKIGDRDVLFDYNDFPYDRLLDGLNHYIIWSAIGTLTPEEIGQIIEENLPGAAAFVFEYVSAFGSIKEIPHYHVVSRQAPAPMPAS